MEVVVSKASQSDRELLENLLQLYIYDFTEFTNQPIPLNGLYKIMPDFESYWIEGQSHPYIIKANGEIAGFILTKEIDEGRKYNYLAHFFVLRKFRGMGIGKRAAEQIFRKSKGEWELNQLLKNVPAQKFWDKVIEDVSKGEVKIRIENGKRYQTFICK
ncbi:GNAT family N-acetyltransferase [Paenibacillus sp. VCA1]|uniref:GNAT family N-acetyltransferase n=1 Tax=Paenibacillus sp. VCA1 TaxID=3039148 RepID=UPI002871AAA3|nr:GNAT family N-acetyltransferase [Paenibacillus sp. VCA1]MDR9856452.1 GNAT family N-acetyltransferase [Paenibacillus sp. VCA1]